MRKNLLAGAGSVLLFVLSILANSSFAQTVVINTGTAGTPAYNAGPIYRSSAASAYDASRYVYLYTQTELAAAGIQPGAVISDLGWVKNNTATSTGGGIFRIFLKNTTAAAFSAATVTWASMNSGATLVYENLNYTVPATAAPNYITFPLTTPFTYTGGSLEVSTEWDINQVAGNPSTGTFDWLWSTVTDRIYGTGQTSLANAATLSSTTNSISTIDNRRPFIQINYSSGSSTCSGTPSAGTASSSASPACYGVPFVLSSAGATNSPGISYQWQISTDGVNGWTDIPGATTVNYTTSQTATNFYRLLVICQANVDISNVVQVVTTPPVSGVFTINSAQATGGTNFQTFNAAYDYIRCGISNAVTFNVVAGSGPYTEQLIMTPVPGASATNTVTFNGNGASINYLSSNTNERAVIKLNGADHIHFNNLVINALGTTTTEYGFGVQLINDADSNSVTNSTININTSSTSTNYAGIVVSASATSATGTGDTKSDFNLFSNNTINGGYYGMTLVGSATEANGNNQITKNQVKDFYFYGIYVNGSFNTLIDSNVISRPARTAVSTFNGVYFTGLSTKAQVTRNTVTNPFGGAPASTAAFNGIYFTAVDALAGLDNEVSNNLIYNLTGNGDVYGLYNSSSDNIHYYHNTVSMDGAAAATTASDITRGFYQTGAASGIDFKNNIISITRGGLSAKYAMYFATATSTITSDRNLFYIGSTTGSNNVGFLTSARVTLADWQAASSQDANSQSSNPLFANAASGNFTPTNASINDMGTPVGILFDIVSAPRNPTTPDVGAFEFTPGGCTAPPVPGTTTVSASPVCQNASVTLGLSGNSVGLGQTYRWQTSTTLAGTYGNIGNVLTNPDTAIIASTTLYYRVAVTCGGSTLYSVPIRLDVNPALPAGTYTINSAAPASATNFVSFNAAKAAMSCGINGPVVFNVVAGGSTYDEQLILDPILNTSATNTVTFNGNGNTISYLSTTTGERAVIKLNGADHIRFNDLNIVAPGTTTTQYGFGVQLLNDADSNVINNCTIQITNASTSTNFAGISVSASATSATTTGNTLCDGNIFSSNSITGGYYGITLVGSTTALLSNNIIAGNTIQDFYLYGIYMSGTDGTLVESNSISRPTRSTTSTFYGVYVTSVHQNARISKNRIHNPYGGNLVGTTAFYGIYFTGVDAAAGTENIVSNNAIYNVNGEGDEYGLYNTSSNNVWYYHNTIAFDNTASGSATAITRGIYQTTLSTGLEFKNNLITIRRGGNGDRHGIYMATSTTTYVSNNNDFYIQGAAGSTFVGYNGTDRVTLADWQAASSQDAASVSINPYYTAPAAGNLIPRASDLDNKGTNVGITSDIVGAVRNASTPDIGAWEFAIGPCNNPPVPGTATASPSSNICPGTPVLLDVTGNSYGAGQTVQWQSATSLAGPWTSMGTALAFPDTTIISSTTLYYRAAFTCGGNTQFSVPVLVSVNPLFPSGIYTINPALPATLPNFTSFASAVAALECGIAGAVTFNVAAGTYTEQIRMHDIFGTGASSRVTFQSANGSASSVTLQFDATDPAFNYVLKLDSASYITYRSLTIKALNATNGRVVELANTASNDSLVNLVLDAAVGTSTTLNSAGVYATALRGGNNVIRGNTISNGTAGIYFAVTASSTSYTNNRIDSNTVNGSYYYGIYASNNQQLSVSKNNVTMSGTLNATAYGIYATNNDSAYVFNGNKVTVQNTTATVYGMYITGSDAIASATGQVIGNRIKAVTANTGNLYGLYETVDFSRTLNNTIAIKTSGASSYAFYHTGGEGSMVYNNSVHSTATSATNNVAAYVAQTTGIAVNMRNNIFSHGGGGRALYVTNPVFTYSDYNLLYTSGPVLVQWGTGNTYATLQQWRDTTFWDLNSISYKPAFISDEDLSPDVTQPEVWAIHGRGTQILGNDRDINGATRPTTLVAGVPDLGAYEFLPTSIPVALTATPASPVANGTQVFMLGTDTVTRINWGATVPTTVTGRRYSGVEPVGLAAGTQHMYFYTDFDFTGTAPTGHTVQQFYIDPWQGTIVDEYTSKLGRTNGAGAWQVGANSTLDPFSNTLRESGLTILDKFTGLTDGVPPPSLPYVVTNDISNKGTRFWVAYGHHYGFNTNSQDMVLYLSAEDAANVQVKVNGTPYVKNYSIAANTVRVTDIIPKYGLVDARITDEGLFDRGISITSDKPIVAYAHIYDGSNSGASMLLPVGVYGYDYVSLNSTQYYPAGGAGSYSWFNVITDRDSTMIEITPSVATKGGRPANVPFTVLLMKGQVYNVMGTQTGAAGTDLTGSHIRAIPNASGKCYPFAVFSGSSRTAICNTTNGDNMIQQVLPSQAWGKKYATFATARSTSNTTYNSNIFRVMVKDPATVVRYNGNTLNQSTLIVPGNYYQFNTTAGTGADGSVYIEADKPVMVAQYMVSTGATSCPGVTVAGVGDPEMIYISPLEQGIKKAVFYNTDEEAITANYINVVVPTAGLASLRIDGSNTFTDVFAHPYLAGYSSVRHNLGATARQHIIECDSSFTAITYGLGTTESYGYNAGTLVRNLNSFPSISNVFGTAGAVTDTTCSKTPFRFSILSPLKPTILEWQLSAVPNMMPNANIIQNNPTPVDSVFINGVKVYRFELAGNYTITGTGTFYVPIVITHPDIESCGNRQENTLTIHVAPAPIADFSSTFTGCQNDPVAFTGIATTNNNAPVSSWSWTFGNGNTGSGQTPTTVYPTPGTYPVHLSFTTVGGCLGDTTKSITVNPRPVVVLVEDTVAVCQGSTAQFAVQNPIAGATYTWYPVPTGGTALSSGSNFTAPAVNGTVLYYVEGNAAGCVSTTRTIATAMLLQPLATPVVVADSIGINMIRFRWAAVPDATGYEVSLDGGSTWIAPSSGATGLTHTVGGLQPLQSVTITVRALGITSCQTSVSAPLNERSRPDEIFIPNSFTPNGDGLNDVLQVYGYGVTELQFTVFNQWGEKIADSRDQRNVWDGMYKGKAQPSGVYLYVCRIVLANGTVLTKKGSINLVR